MGLALNGARLALLRSGVAERSLFNDFGTELQALPFVAMGLLLFGVVRLAMRERSVHIANYGPGAANVQTLILPRATASA